MVDVTIHDNILDVEVEGIDKILSLHSSLQIPLKKVKRIHNDMASTDRIQKELGEPGLRFPEMVMAGTFYRHGKRIFCDVRNPERSVVIDLDNERFNELIVEVSNPNGVIAEVRDALKARGLGDDESAHGFRSVSPAENTTTKPEKKKMTLDIPLDTDVYCSDEICGRSKAIVINPISNEITHIIVATREMLASEYLVPVTLIEESGPDRIQLRCNRNQLATLDPFHKVKFVSLSDLEESDRPLNDIPEAQVSSAWLWPYITVEGEFGTYIDVEQVPARELSVSRGTSVMASDGRVGQVDEFIVNPANDNITHLVMREGHIWGKKDIIIPVSEIDHVESATVYLKSSKDAIEKLPTMPLKRHCR